eukprot:GEMP01041626.1.p1 GENE.GEMP01041626.1~~GEMP01041626.1.p1  ORF type:complete len:422 (+),score=77.92 GEMP01041626.1:72-1337(+)
MGDSQSKRDQDDDEPRSSCHTRKGDLPVPSATVKWFTNDAREATYISRRADRAIDAGLKKADAKLKQAQQYEFLAEQAKKKAQKYARQVVIQAHPEIQKLLQQCQDIAVSKGLDNLEDLQQLCRTESIVKKLPNGGTKVITATDLLQKTKPIAPAINEFFPHATAVKIVGKAFHSKDELRCTDWGLRVVSDPAKPPDASGNTNGIPSGNAEKQDFHIRVRLECPKDPKCGDDLTGNQAPAEAPKKHEHNLDQSKTPMQSVPDGNMRPIGSNSPPCHHEHSKDFFIPKSRFDSVDHMQNAHKYLKNLMPICCHVPSFVDKLTDVHIGDVGAHMHHLSKSTAEQTMQGELRPRIAVFIYIRLTPSHSSEIMTLLFTNRISSLSSHSEKSNIVKANFFKYLLFLFLLCIIIGIGGGITRDKLQK